MVTALLCVSLFLPQDDASTKAAIAAAAVRDDRYVEIVDLKLPKAVVLEVGGIVAHGNDLFVATRRGEVWHVLDAYGQAPRCELWAEGLQEPLGLVEKDGWLWCSQRGELSRMRDRSGRGRMDELQTVAQGWPLSGNYHEYCFGPAFAPDGIWLTLNKPFGDEPFGRADWRGWAIRIQPDGHWDPVCAGLRSPAGVGTSPWGEVFYSDNQGEWCATCKFAPLHEGDFHGHPWGIDSCKLPASKVPFPGEVKSGLRIDAAASTIPGYRLPAVWIPYDRLGRSASGFVWDTAGNFPPYRNQVFVGDQYSSEVFRISLEKVGERWQGACYPFRRGLACGMTRVQWGTDGSLWCGETNRGWPSAGSEQYGLQRLRWRGPTPCDLVEVTATRDGFRLRFSAPLQKASVVPASFRVHNWTYDHHADYGCPERDTRELAVRGAALGDGDTVVDLQVEGLVDTRVHMLEAPGVRAADGSEPWHAVAWYTRNASPR